MLHKRLLNMKAEIIWTFLTGLLCGGYNVVESTQVIPRLGYGAVFKEVGTVDMSSNYWKHSFLIKFLDPPELELKFRDDCNLTKDEALVQWCDDFKSAIVNHQAQVQYLVNNIRKHEGILKHLLPEDRYFNDTSQNSAHSRTKRGIIDGIGKGMKWLFGTAVDEDVQDMKASLKFATASYKKMKSYQSYLNSYLVKTNKRVDNAIHMLNFNHDIIQGAINNISDYRRRASHRLAGLERTTESVVKLTQFTSALVLRMSQLIDQLHLLHHHGEKKLHAARRLLENRLPVELVTPFDLRKMIKTVEENLQDKFGDFHVSVDNVGQFYAQDSISYGFDDSYLVIYIKIPITNMKSQFKVYETTVTGTPLMVNFTQNGNRSMEIKNVSPYLAVAMDDSYFVELSHAQYQSCISNPFKKCPRSVTLKPMDQPSCTLAVYYGSHMDIIEKCHIQYVRNSVPQPLTYPLGDGNVLIRSSAQMGPWRKTCRGQDPEEEMIQPCQFCTVENRCCELYSEEFYIPMDVSSCEKNNYSTTVKHIQSVPFLALFHSNITDDNSTDGNGEYYGDIAVNLDRVDRQWKLALEEDNQGKTDLEMLGFLISKNTMENVDTTIDPRLVLERYTNYFVYSFFGFGFLLILVYIILFFGCLRIRRMMRQHKKMYNAL